MVQPWRQASRQQGREGSTSSQQELLGSRDLPARDPAVQGSRRRLGERRPDQTCPARDWHGAGTHRKLGSGWDLPTETGLGRRGAALGMERGRGSSLIPAPGKEGLGTHGQPSSVGFGDRQGPWQGEFWVTTAGQGLGWGQPDRARGHQRVETSGSAWIWQEMAGPD